MGPGVVAADGGGVGGVQKVGSVGGLVGVGAGGFRTGPVLPVPQATGMEKQL